MLAYIEGLVYLCITLFNQTFLIMENNIKELRDGLTIDLIKEKYSFLLELDFEDAIIGERYGKIFWYEGIVYNSGNNFLGGISGNVEIKTDPKRKKWRELWKNGTWITDTVG